MKTKLLLLVAVVCSISIGFAQDTAPPSEPYTPSYTQFMVRGYAHAGLNYKKVGEDVESTFVGTTFNPIFMYRHGKRLLFETELSFAFEDGKLDIGFEYANMSYLINDYMTLRMGKMLLPFGTFLERLHPDWINKFANAPLGFGHGGISPASGVGVELRGAIPVGSAKVLYSVYATNGPVLNTGLDEDGNPDEPDEAGQLIFNNFIDNNNKKGYGGRLALLPFANSSLEIGASAYGGQAGDRNTPYASVGAMMYAFDLSFVRQVSAVKGIIDIKSQYNITNVDDAIYFEPEEDPNNIPGGIILTPYTFDNSADAFFAQMSYRPSMAGNDIVKRFEVAYRYSSFNAPEGSEWEQQSKQWSVALNYYMNWRTLFKLSYQSTDQTGGHGVPEGVTQNTKGVFVHWALGF
jgi:hypothetical protein